MLKTKIGTWNDYSVFLNKDKKKVFWTIEDKSGKVQNRFNDKESFGHWVFHSGFKPEGVLEEKTKVLQSEKEIKKSKPFGDVSTMPIKFLIKAGSLSIEQLRHQTVYKAKAGLTPIKKQVRGKKGTYQQTFYVRVGEKVSKKDLLLKTVSEDQILEFKEGKNLNLYVKLVEPVINSRYRDTGLHSVGIEHHDAYQEGQIKALMALRDYKMGRGGGAKLSSMVYAYVYRKFQNMYSTAKSRRAQIDRFDVFDTLKSAVNLEEQLQVRQELKEILGQMKATKEKVSSAIQQELEGRKQLTPKRRKEIFDMFGDWTMGLGWGALAKKYSSHKVGIQSTFKRIIFPQLEKLVVKKEQLSPELAEKQKFLKKSDDNINKGAVLMYYYMAQMLGERSKFEVDDSKIKRANIGAKLELIKKTFKLIKGKREEKLLYRLLTNLDVFTVRFIVNLFKCTFKDIGKEGVYGYVIDDGQITIFDGDSLGVMQYNMVLSLIDFFIRKDKVSQEILEMYKVDIDEKVLDMFDKKFRKEFHFTINDNVLYSYVVFNVLIEFLNSLDYRDNEKKRYLKVQVKSDEKFNDVYSRVLE